jgi:hypothetical protein
MNFENATLSERDTHDRLYCMILFVWNCQTNPLKQKADLCLSGVGRVTALGTLWGWWKYCKISGANHTNCEGTKCDWIVYSKI